MELMVKEKNIKKVGARARHGLLCWLLAGWILILSARPVAADPLLSYGMTGFAFGYFSLRKIEGKIKKYFRGINPFFIKAFIIYLSSYGIYLGRFLRWNSWDIITNFVPLIRDVFKTIKHPVQNAAAWGFTILFGTLLNILFFILEAVSTGSDSSAVRVDVEVY